VAEEGLAQARHELRGARRGVGRGAERPRGARHEFERRLDLGPVRVAREELGAVEDHGERGAHVAVRATEGVGGARHERRRGRVAHEAHRELAGDEARRARVAGDEVEHALALGLAAAGREALTQHHLLVGVVHRGAEDEPAPCRARPAGRPSSR
jgi:hypothetical protein